MIKNLKKLILAVTLFSVSFASVSEYNISFAEKASPAELLKVNDNGVIDWYRGIIRVKGAGAPPETGGAAQKRLKARLAARSDAYRNLLEIVKGVQVSSETTVNNFVTQSDVIVLRVDGVVRGARQISEKHYEDGTEEVELALPLFGNGSIASAIELGNYVKNKRSVEALMSYRVAALKDFALTDELEPTRISMTNSDNVTGLIVDARDLGVEPAMSPFIVGGAKIVYAGGTINIDPENIVKYGITEYTNSLEDAKSKVDRVGKEPMIIEARGAVGRPSRTNILLNEQTINSLMEANEKHKFLNDLRVVIVI